MAVLSPFSMFRRIVAGSMALASVLGAAAVAAPMQLRSQFSAHQLQGEAIVQVLCSETSDAFATTASDGFVRIWKAPNQQLVQHTVEPRSMMFNGRFIPGGAPTDFIAASYNGFAYRWSGSAPEPIKIGPHLSGVTDVTFAPRTGLVVTSSDDGFVRFWSADRRLLKRTALPGVTRHLASSPLLQLLASSQDIGTVSLHSPEGELLATLPTGQGRLNALIFSAHQPLLLTGGFDGSIKVWTFEQGPTTPRLLRTIPPLPKQGWLEGLAINRDGVIAAVSDDGMLRLWSLRGQLLASQLLSEEHHAMSVCFAKDQRTIHAISQDGALSTLSWLGN